MDVSTIESSSGGSQQQQQQHGGGPPHYNPSQYQHPSQAYPYNYPQQQYANQGYYQPPVSGYHPDNRPSYAAPIIIQQNIPVRQSFTGYIVMSCLVFWFCGWLFGGIAFILAVVASSTASEGDQEGAKCLGCASLALSITGLLVGLAVWGWLIWYIVAVLYYVDSAYNYGSSSSCTYTCYGSCYNYRSSYSSSYCSSYYYDECYSGSYCYYNY